MRNPGVGNLPMLTYGWKKVYKRLHLLYLQGNA